MSERIIQTADLSAISGGLRTLSRNIEDVGERIDKVDDTVTITRKELFDLQAQFHQFLDTYNRATQVSLAETRLIKIRQELTSKFGHYGDVRRAAVGLLQATDISVVHTATMRDITEELMVLTPAYWLAPALVALRGHGDPLCVAREALLAAQQGVQQTTTMVAKHGRAAIHGERSRAFVDPGAMVAQLLIQGYFNVVQAMYPANGQ